MTFENRAVQYVNYRHVARWHPLKKQNKTKTEEGANRSVTAISVIQRVWWQEGLYLRASYTRSYEYYDLFIIYSLFVPTGI